MPTGRDRGFYVRVFESGVETSVLVKDVLECVLESQRETCDSLELSDIRPNRVLETQRPSSFGKNEARIACPSRGRAGFVAFCVFWKRSFFFCALREKRDAVRHWCLARIWRASLGALAKRPRACRLDGRGASRVPFSQRSSVSREFLRFRTKDSVLKSPRTALARA